MGWGEGEEKGREGKEEAIRMEDDEEGKEREERTAAPTAGDEVASFEEEEPSSPKPLDAPLLLDGTGEGELDPPPLLPVFPSFCAAAGAALC